MSLGTIRKAVVHALVALFCLAFLADGMPRPRVTTSGNPKLDAVYESVSDRYGVDVNVLIEQGRQESGFRWNAVSPAGAAGPAQFMPGTARRYGLVVNSFRDERFDYWKSIDAQGRYMRDLLDRFKGRYDLALAGYNAGENRRSLREGRVPAIPETRNYVSTILRKSKIDGQNQMAVPEKDGRGTQAFIPSVRKVRENGLIGHGVTSRPDLRITRSVSWVGKEGN